MSGSRTKSILLTLACGLLCGVPALWVMWPVLMTGGSAVPGLHGGDNLAALWNVWWFIERQDVTGWPYWTPMLFAPVGTQLSLHTHATTHSVIAWIFSSFTPIVSAHNLALTLGFMLNGVVTFALALRASRSLLGSVAAGVVFAASAAVQLRGLGHINLAHAWVLPLFGLASLHLADRPSALRSVAVGLAGALVLYTDYYYLVYAGILVALWTALRLLTCTFRRLPRRSGLVGALLIALLVVDVAVVLTIAATGGTSLNIGAATVSLRGLRNPLTVGWFLVLAWAVWRYPFRLAVGWRSGRPSFSNGVPVLVAAVTFLVASLPVLAALARVLASGEYTTQRVLWRSSPPGADLLTLLTGHPTHLLTGEWTRSVYGGLGIDMMEQSLWIGLVPLVTVLVFARRWWSVSEVRMWALTAIVFGVLALGPFLRIAGYDLALPLPHAVLRYTPVVSNARIPGRAVVMVQLAVAVLLAYSLARRTPRTAALIVALLVAETLPAPLPVHVLPPPDMLDQLLRTSASRGAVAELPLGLRDGFLHEGQLDHRALVHQMAHGRPLVGGFVARLAPGIRTVYRQTPILDEMLRMSNPSEPAAVLDAGAGGRALAAGLAFVVVNRDTFVDARLPRGMLEGAGFRLVQTAGSRELYEAVRSPASNPAPR